MLCLRERRLWTPLTAKEKINKRIYFRTLNWRGCVASKDCDATDE
jgi:hypothetical protein